MSALTRMRRGWHLGFQSLRIVFRDKTLLLYPLIPLTMAITLIVFFYRIVGPDKLFWVIFVVNSLEHAQYVALGYLVIAVASVFFSLGLVACTRITIDERDSNFIDGMLASLRKFHWVVLWALVSWTIGPILNMLDHLRYTSQWVRKVTKTNWSQLSYFLLPILVVDNINLFSAIRRSSQTMAKTWGDGAVSRLGFMWFFWLMNVPTIALFIYGHYLEGPWPKSLTFVLMAMVYSTLVIYQTIAAILSVVLYKYATDGTVVKGFDANWMKGAFERPKVYVLVDPAEIAAPGAVDGVPAPEGVEPLAAADEGGLETEVAPDDVPDAVEPEPVSLDEASPASEESEPEPADEEQEQSEPKQEP